MIKTFFVGDFTYCDHQPPGWPSVILTSCSQFPLTLNRANLCNPARSEKTSKVLICSFLVTCSAGSQQPLWEDTQGVLSSNIS